MTSSVRLHKSNQMHRGRRLVLALSAAIALASCGPTTGTLDNPRTTDSDGRAVVSAGEAFAAFRSACYAPGATHNGARNFAQRNGYEVQDDVEGVIFWAAHPAKSIDVSHLDAGICSVGFDAGIPNASAGGQAAQLVISEIGVTGMSGKKGGGQVNFQTTKGAVIISNNARARTNINGATISLSKL